MEEGQGEVARDGGGIGYLDGRGLIDGDRGGLIGFSRTFVFVEYALTHATYHFAAASVSDGLDGGYFQYVAFTNAQPSAASFEEGVNGGKPFGAGLTSWMRTAPGFNVDKVGAPVRIVA